jgi:hypothetical protein
MPVGLLALDPRLTGAIEGGLNQVGPGLDRFFGAVTPKPVQDFGRSMEQYGWGAFNGFVPGEITAASVSTPERAKGTQAILNGKPVYWTGSKYGWQSGPSAAKAGLLGSEVVGDDVFAPVIGTTLTPPDAPILPPPQRGAADRAYQQEKDRVTQMTEQDPLFKKYQVAELTKAYNTASPEEKNKIGLQIWAATNPTLVKKVPAGQVGYQTSASMFGSQAFGTDVPGVTETSYSQIGQQGGVPGGVQFPGAEQATKMPVFSMGADAQQLGVTPPGTTPFPMIGKNVFKRGFEVPSSEDLSQTQLALLKRAFESRIQQKYGISGTQTRAEQMPKVLQYFEDRGYKPGMGLGRAYATVLLGNPNESLTGKDSFGTSPAGMLSRFKKGGDYYTNAQRVLGDPL